MVASVAAQTAPPRFVMACAPCHGFDGIGHDAATPNLAGQHAAYLYNQMAAFRVGERKHPEMNFFSGQMTQDEMRAIAEYYSRLRR
jgi:cytochrome c553